MQCLNTELFKAASIEPQSMKSWDDVIAAVKAISKDGVSGYSMANGGEGRFTFRDFMMISLSNGFTPDDTSDATKSKYLETLTFIKNLSPYMPKSQSTWLYPELFKAWEAGTVGMMHTGAYFTANVISHGKEAMKRTEIVPMPAGPSSDKQTIMVGSNGYAMMAGSTQKEAAWKFIEVALSEPILGKLCGSLNVPAVNYLSDEVLLKYAKVAYGDDVGAQHIELVKAFQAAADKMGVPMPAILGQSAMEKVLQGAIVKLTSDSVSPEQAYQEIKKGIDAVKEQQK
ncbi:MAG: extracellular solute-binding protein [Ruminiclostridium sp.]